MICFALLIALNLKFHRKLFVITLRYLVISFFFIAFHSYLKLVLLFSYLFCSYHFFSMVNPLRVGLCPREQLSLYKAGHLPT